MDVVGGKEPPNCVVKLSADSDSQKMWKVVLQEKETVLHQRKYVSWSSDDIGCFECSCILWRLLQASVFICDDWRACGTREGEKCSKTETVSRLPGPRLRGRHGIWIRHHDEVQHHQERASQHHALSTQEGGRRSRGTLRQVPLKNTLSNYNYGLKRFGFNQTFKTYILGHFSLIGTSCPGPLVHYKCQFEQTFAYY